MARTGRNVAVPIAAENAGGMEGLGLVLVLTFLFLSYSRATDFLLPGLRLTLLVSLVGLLVTILSGGLQRAFASPVGLWLLAFSVWLVIDVPFSVWKGGSVEML